MSRNPNCDPTRAGLPLERWPEADRGAWARARQRSGGPFRKNGGGSRSEATLEKAEKSVRRWLGFLQRRGELDPGEQPHERLTRDRIAGYFEHLLACGNSGRTVLGRFEDLRQALELMCPGQSFEWLTQPDGFSLRSQLDMQPRHVFVPDNAETLAWASDLFREAVPLIDPRTRLTQVRDAVIIAILATRAPRLRALSSLRLGVHVHRDHATWLLDQRADLTKMRKPLMLPLSAEVGAMLDRYVTVERLELLDGRSDDALWISERFGTALKSAALSGMIQRRTLSRFGVGFGPHRFRNSLTTAVALESPGTPFDASMILGHSPGVSLKHYNRAKAIAASNRHQDRLRELKRATEALARRAMGDEV